MLGLRIECDIAAQRTIPRSRNRRGDGYRSAELLVARSQVERVQPLMEGTGRSFRLADDVKRSAGRIDDRCACDPNLGLNVLKAIAHISSRHRSFADRSAVPGIDDVGLP